MMAFDPRMLRAAFVASTTHCTVCAVFKPLKRIRNIKINKRRGGGEREKSTSSLEIFSKVLEIEINTIEVVVLGEIGDCCTVLCSRESSVGRILPATF